MKKGDTLIKVGDDVDDWIKAELNGLSGLVPNFEKFNTPPIIVFIALNQTQCRPIILATPFHTLAPLMPTRTRSTPELHSMDTITGQERRNSD